MIDLRSLTDLERAHLERCVADYYRGLECSAFSRLMESEQNPLLQATGGWIMQAVYEHPLFRAIRDLQYRLGLAQGRIGLDPGNDPARDPFADEWIPTAEAAARKGVTLPGLHQAIRRGVVIAAPITPGGRRLAVA